MPNRVLRDWTDSIPINGLTVHAERFFTRLIMKVDDTGRFFADTRLLKAGLFPLLLDQIREADISRWIAECEKAGLIALYNRSGKPYLEINNFKQRLRIMRSKFPERPPNDSQTADIRPPETETNPETKQEPAQARDDFSYENFIKVFNELTRSQYKGDVTSKGQFSARQREGYKKEDFRRAVENCAADPFHKEKNFKHLTPEFILRPDKFQKFLNAVPVNTAPPTATKQKTDLTIDINREVQWKINGKYGRIAGVENGVSYKIMFNDGHSVEAAPHEVLFIKPRAKSEPTSISNFIPHT